MGGEAGLEVCREVLSDRLYARETGGDIHRKHARMDETLIFLGEIIRFAREFYMAA